MLFSVFLHKSHIWEKSCFWDIGENSLGQSDCRILKSTISPEEIDETALFLHVDKNSPKLKVDWKFLIGHGQKWVWPIWSQNFKIDGISRMNRFLQAVRNLRKLKVDWIFFGLAWSKMCVPSLVTRLLNWQFKNWTDKIGTNSVKLKVDSMFF